jgi:hypothetical protein
MCAGVPRLQRNGALACSIGNTDDICETAISVLQNALDACRWQERCRSQGEFGTSRWPLSDGITSVAGV